MGRLNMTATVVPTILSHKNYGDWSFRMKTYFKAEDLWGIVKGTVNKPPGGEERKVWKKKDAKALYAIHNSCGDHAYTLIKYNISAEAAWKRLSDIFKHVGPPDDESAYKSVGEAYPNRSKSALEEGLSVTGGAGHDDIEETFVKYVKSHDWGNAINFLRQHPQAASARVSLDGTALHYAIRKRCSVRIIQQLVELMATEHLEIQDKLGCTALYFLVSNYPEMVKVAECMVKKNHNLLTISPMWNTKPPVLSAQGNAKGERMARCLYSLTSPETIKVIDAAQLISDGFRHQRFDIAWNLIQHYPKLAMAIDHDGNTPLATLASNRFAFKSGRALSLWEKLVYYGIRIKPLPSITNDSHIIVDQGPLAEQKENKRHHLISSGMGLFRRLVANLQILLRINHIHQMKLVHERLQQFLPLMCKAVSQEDMSDYQRRKLDEALCVAVERGHMEYITHLLRYSSYPIFKVKNEKLQSLFQIAAECRQHNVYILICIWLQNQDKYESEYGLDYFEGLKEMVEHKDDLGNNMLHTVARITSLSQIDHQGGIAQMQNELQWFKKVRSIADVKDCESVNNDNKTPREVFTENHKEMLKRATNSMKETANSSIVGAALIITIMFAAVFTVPGGYDGGTGLPIFLTKKEFITFMVSDALSLFSSIASIIIFLGIITSRYNEDDFHKSLPTKMTVGLFTLFLSIVAMIIVFSCALYIMLDGKSSIIIPTILLASVPLSSFIWIQLPLLVESFLLLASESEVSYFLRNL